MRMKLLRLALLAFLLLPFGSCTHNDGDIGMLFGSWHLTEMTVDGERVADYDGDVFWMFQNSVVCMRQVLPYHEVDERWGDWRWAAKGQLLLNFNHYDELREPDDPSYLPLPQMGLIAGDNIMHVEHLTGNRMRLSYANRVYFFKKH